MDNEYLGDGSVFFVGNVGNVLKTHITSSNMGIQMTSLWIHEDVFEMSD